MLFQLSYACFLLMSLFSCLMALIWLVEFPNTIHETRKGVWACPPLRKLTIFLKSAFNFIKCSLNQTCQPMVVTKLAFSPISQAISSKKLKLCCYSQLVHLYYISTNLTTIIFINVYKRNFTKRVAANRTPLEEHILGFCSLTKINC